MPDLSQFLTNQLPTLLVAVIGVPIAIGLYIVGFEFLVRLLPDGAQPKARPWIWVGPRWCSSPSSWSSP